MSDLANKIDAVISERQSQLPLVRGYVDAIDKFDAALRTVESTLAEAVEDPAIGSEIRPLLEEFRTVSPLSKIEQMRQAMSVVRARFERGTINIGVSGQARVGKSTLLQRLSGLGDEQIPTGEGLPVTAVRSRIEHSSQNIALVKFHDWTSFRREVLDPFYREIGLGTAPATPEAFQASTPGDGIARESMKSRQLTMLEDLKAAHGGFGSYRSLLSGQEERKPLDQISAYVRKTYATDGQPANMLYLAVQKVRILCTFPANDVQRLVLVDLPGLGEISPDAEGRHLDGLQHDTDLVVMIKRPDSSQACDWDEKDAQALDLVERARGDLKRTSDFLFLLKNQSPSDSPSLIQALSHALETKVNAPRTHDPLTILAADANARDGAIDGVLRPVLTHLANNLGRMDSEVLDGAVARVAESAKGLSGLLATLSDTLKSLGREGDDFHQIVERARGMRRKLAVDLEEQVRLRLKRARDQVEDDQYIERVESIYQSINDDLQSGFRGDREAWVRDLYESIRADGQTSPTAGQEINRIRVEISRRFNGLDGYFQVRVDKLIDDIAQIVSTHTGSLLSGRTGRDALRYFKDLAAEADHPAEGLSSATSELLGLKIEYKTHLHPHVRQELDVLQLERDNPDNPGEKVLVVSGDVSESGAEKVATELVQLGRQAAWGVRKALLQQAVVPELILHAAAEQFVDATIRHGNYEAEFQEIARAYRDNIWPGVFQGMKVRSVRIARLRSALRDASDCSSKLIGGN